MEKQSINVEERYSHNVLFYDSFFSANKTNQEKVEDRSVIEPLDAHPKSKHHKKKTDPVQEEFLKLAKVLPKKIMEKIISLDLVEQIFSKSSKELHEKKENSDQKTDFNSPYFSIKYQNNVKHLPLIKRFLQVVKKNEVRVIAQDRSQAGLALQNLWKLACSCSSQNTFFDKTLLSSSQVVLQLGKELHLPVQDNSGSHTKSGSLAVGQDPDQFFEAITHFGYHYFTCCVNALQKAQ